MSRPIRNYVASIGYYLRPQSCLVRLVGSTRVRKVLVSFGRETIPPSCRVDGRHILACMALSVRESPTVIIGIYVLCVALVHVESETREQARFT